MPGLNLTGTKNTKDLTVGRGKLYLCELDANGQPTLGWRFVGNAPQLNVSVEAETLEHQDSTEGLRVTDLEITITQTVSVSAQFDELNFQNLALFFSGETASYDNTAAGAGGGVTGTDNFTVYQKGRWYDLYKGAGGVPSSNANNSRIYDIGTVTLEPSGGGTPYVVNTDYVVDAVLGRIFIPSTSTMTADAVNGVDYNLDIAANSGAAIAVDEVRALTKTAVTLGMKFVHINANGNFVKEYQFHQIRLRAEGDLQLIADEFTSMSLQGTAEKNEVAGGTASPTLTIRTHTNAVAA